MVNTRRMTPLVWAVSCYIVVTLATVVALGVLSLSGSSAATAHAWGHALVVLVFAGLLPLRLRAARRGSRSGLRAVGLISGVLLLVNAVESSLGYFPGWMRAEMVLTSVLMAGTVLLVALTAVAWNRHTSAAGSN